MTFYIDKLGAEIFVSPGIASDGKTWMTVRQERHKFGTHRIVSKALPIRQSKAEAQADLDAYAGKKGWWLMPELLPASDEAQQR
jgi:hypothetical protein